MFAVPPPASSAHRPLSASCTIKSQLRCLFSRSTSALSLRPTTPAVMRQQPRKERTGRVGGASSHQIEYNRSKVEGKRRRNSRIGAEEEKRIMTILHNLHVLRNNPVALTDLYIKPLPEYIQEKLKQYQDTGQLTPPLPPTILVEEPLQISPSALNEGSPPEKIQLPEKRPMITSRWQQKMLTKLERMEQAASPSPVSAPPVSVTSGKQSTISRAPHLLSISNRQLTVHGQGSTCTPKALPSRYKPPIPIPPPAKSKLSFSYSDPIPVPVSYLSHRQDPLSPFEERLLELEKLERDSVAIERNAKPRAPKEATSRIPATLLTPTQPKYLDSTIAYQIRVANQKRQSHRNTPSPVKPEKRRSNRDVKYKTGKIALVTRS